MLHAYGNVYGARFHVFYPYPKASADPNEQICCIIGKQDYS